LIPGKVCFAKENGTEYKISSLLNHAAECQYQKRKSMKKKLKQLALPTKDVGEEK